MKIIAKNKRARYDYEITKTYIAGIALLGSEVKSVKNGHVSLKGSFVHLRDSELWLHNVHINPYKFAADPNYDPTRTRKLLLHKRELKDIIQTISQEGVGAVPMCVGLERGLVKVEIGIGRGKKRFDKRETIKKRIMLREANRESKLK